MSKPISPAMAADLIAAGAILVDIRSLDEHARVRIPGAEPHPLEALAAAAPLEAHTVIFHCGSGMRAAANARLLASCTTGDAYILEGGLDAWPKAGLSVRQDRSQPLDIVRQTQIVAGALVLIGVALGSLVTPAFYAISAAIGVGLMSAGITGTCGLARVLIWLSPRRSSTLAP